MAEAPRLSLSGLRHIVSDGDELAKGAAVFDGKGLDHLSRFENKIFADARGSGASPYKVQIHFEETDAKGRCSCMAARSRPFCKHAAALLVAWARAPEAFAVADAPPPSLTTGAKKAAVKKGKSETSALRGHGVAQMAALVRELAVTGVASLATVRAEQVRAIGESLRESSLRRLSARTIDLANRLEQAARDASSLDPVEYADLLADLLLTVRKLEKHLAGEALDDKYVEELIGKTWTKKDRKPVAGLSLVEYGFVSRVTPDDFVLRESRFFDVASGEHYSEKQILPAFLAKRTEPKKSWTGRLLSGAHGSLYPSFAPLRLDLESTGEQRSLEPATLEDLLAKALPGVGAALLAFQERRKDVFAPDSLPVAIAVDTILAEGPRMQIVDGSDAALFLPDDPALQERLAGALRGAKLKALLGDVTLDGALPTLVPMAAIVDSAFGLELRTLSSSGAALITGKKLSAAAKARAKEERSTRVSAWVDTARSAGASAAAISLGEVREELAQGLVTGLVAFGPRFALPLASRLKDLGLEKQAGVLVAAAAKDDAAEKLDDFVKIYQILGIALTRLAGATQVQRASLEPVPTFESVFVKRVETVLTPKEVGVLAAQNSLSRYQAAVHYAKYYASIPAEELARSIFPTWADGAASPFVARAFASKPVEAVKAARRALGLDGSADAARRRHYGPQARVSRITAIRVLEAVNTPESRLVLAEVMTREQDASLRSHARRALAGLNGAQRDEAPPEFFKYRDSMLSGPIKDERIAAMRLMVRLGIVDAIPYLRASLAGDISREVREEAAYALAQIGDVDCVETFVRMLRRRGEDDEEAKIGAYALGYLGDVRGIEELLDAWESGWNKPAILADAIRSIGAAILEPLVDRIERNPELAARKALEGIIAAMPVDEIKEVLCARLELRRESPDFPELAKTLTALAKMHESVMKAYVIKCAEIRPAILLKKASTEDRALAKKLALNVV